MIVGFENPKIKIGSNEIDFHDSVLYPDFIKPLLIESISPINGQRIYKYLGDYSSFRLEINLNQYSDKYFIQQLKSLEGQVALFYPHKDYSAVKDRFGNNLLFMILPIQFFYKENEIEFDTCVMTFNSIGFADYTGVWNILGFGYQFGLNYGWGL